MESTLYQEVCQCLKENNWTEENMVVEFWLKSEDYFNSDKERLQLISKTFFRLYGVDLLVKEVIQLFFCLDLTEDYHHIRNESNWAYAKEEQANLARVIGFLEDQDKPKEASQRLHSIALDFNELVDQRMVSKDRILLKDSVIKDHFLTYLNSIREHIVAKEKELSEFIASYTPKKDSAKKREHIVMLLAQILSVKEGDASKQAARKIYLVIEAFEKAKLLNTTHMTKNNESVNLESIRSTLRNIKISGENSI